MTLLVLGGGVISMARAETATFTSTTDVLTDDDLARLATVNNDGYVLNRGSTMVIELATAFATSSVDDFLTLYYSNPSRGRRWIGINFGYEVNGVVQWALSSPYWVLTRGSGQITFTGFSNYCSVAGGCSFISFTGGSRAGTQIDAVAVNGQVLTPAAPTPEPNIWALLIIGFIVIAWKLRYNKQKSPYNPSYN
ncbi:MAG: hypothetical protein ACWA5L_09310 [bacterium]